MTMETRKQSNEEWRPVVGYENCYEVSNLGRVRSVERTLNRSDGRKHTVKATLLHQHNHQKGYKVVGLSMDGIQKLAKVHRIVAIAFIPNPDNLSMVNHKDEDKTNNRVENLEWCDNKYNCNYGTVQARLTEIRKKSWLAVIGTDISGKEHRFASIQEAANHVGGKAPCISQCCRKIQGKHSAYGYKWRYEDEKLNIYYAERAERTRKTHDKPVIATDNKGRDIFFASIKVGSEKTGANRTSIVGCCRGKYGCHTAGGYRWRYANI